MRIALLQLASHGADRDRNLEVGLRACRDAAATGADFALLPEMWSIGYTFPKQGLHEASTPVDDSYFDALAEPADGDWVQSFRELAKELEMAIGVGYLEQTATGSRNTISVFDRSGHEVLRYAKSHLCTFGSESALVAGDEFVVADLDLGNGASVRLGALICYDREFPEAARVVMLEGAELVVVPNACEIDSNRMAQLRTRAFENMFAVAMTNYASPDHNGQSVVFDGIAVDEAGAMRDMTVAVGGEHVELVLADLDLDRLRRYREREVWGPKHRHPNLYDRLVDES